ncbi:MAG: class IIb bacteriocin, lactobin A/cerein 7B family [Candidatus Azobacteroides sp.]|nr:class IIb bacteriocin, lactobin A/cerein 7B family [Candidatus Azobacteroides sp.]
MKTFELESLGLKELSQQEMMDANGGIWQFVIGVGIGLAVGYVLLK